MTPQGNQLKPVRVAVGGQTPPPMSGQFVMVSAILDELREDPRLTVEHIPFRFTRAPEDQGTRRVGKLLEVFSVWARAIRGLTGGRYDVTLYPIGGTKSGAIARDLLVLPLLRITSRKLVLHFHGGGHASRQWKGKLDLRALAGYVYRRADLAIVMTPFNRRDPEAVGIRQVEVLQHRLTDSLDDTLRVGREAGSTILYIGHVRPEKGFPEILEAVASVVDREPEIRLLIAGELLPPFSEDILWSDARRLGIEDRVHLLGPVSGHSKWKALAAADLAVFPSRAIYESFGLVLVEAMMWKLPLVATDWRGNKDVAGELGTVYFPVNENFAGEFTKALHTAFDNRDLWDEWGTANRARFLEHFSRDSQGRKLADVLRELAT